MKSNQRISRSKLTKHRVMSRDARLRNALPATYRMNKARFFSMLQTYRSIIVKPTGKWGGEGVVLVEESAPGEYKVHVEKTRKTFSTGESLYAYVKQKVRSACIVQRRIRLAAVGGRPFDLRVMVQRHREKTDWKVTGKLAKIAGKGYIVTNIRRSKGRVASVSRAIRQSDMKTKDVKAICGKIDRIALRSAKTLHAYYRSIDTVGLDIGLDRKGHVWIIEPNFTPMIGLFLHLKDKNQYRRIMSYRRGRAVT
ncbi:YheC/YheD family protein [Paenibacillus humicola]|uniref:YheC/YheD family protein n=1 Tax=Paenibacillus humicola TaxID=3110540 RepID=UPI00237BC692|nr:YheC/YheD family protein [Paenibacillus humicola]